MHNTLTRVGSLAADTEVREKRISKKKIFDFIGSVIAINESPTVDYTIYEKAQGHFFGPLHKLP